MEQNVWQQKWLAALADTGPWAEPTFAHSTCTDAGATYVIVSLPNRPFLLHAAPIMIIHQVCAGKLVSDWEMVDVEPMMARLKAP